LAFSFFHVAVSWQSEGRGYFSPASLPGVAFPPPLLGQLSAHAGIDVRNSDESLIAGDSNSYIWKPDLKLLLMQILVAV